jgi:hypothetical protein
VRSRFLGARNLLAGYGTGFQYFWIDELVKNMDGERQGIDQVIKPEIGEDVVEWRFFVAGERA